MGTVAWEGGSLACYSRSKRGSLEAHFDDSAQSAYSSRAPSACMPSDSIASAVPSSKAALAYSGIRALVQALDDSELPDCRSKGLRAFGGAPSSRLQADRLGAPERPRASQQGLIM